MDIKKNDILTLEDNNEYVVVSKVTYDDANYLYIVDLNDVKNIKFVKENNDEVLEISDKDLISELIPLFIEDTDAASLFKE